MLPTTVHESLQGVWTDEMLRWHVRWHIIKRQGRPGEHTGLKVITQVPNMLWCKQKVPVGVGKGEAYFV